MAANVLVDAGFVVALLSSRDAHHPWAAAHALQFAPPWSTCESALSEAFYLVGARGAPGLSALLRRRSVLVAFDLAADVNLLHSPVAHILDRIVDQVLENLAQTGFFASERGKALVD